MVESTVEWSSLNGVDVAPPPAVAPWWSIALALAWFAGIGLLLGCIFFKGRNHFQAFFSSRNQGGQALRPGPKQPLAANAMNDFSKCLLPDGDVDVFAFERACRNFSDHILDPIGTMGSKLNVQSMEENLQKVRQSLLALELDTGMPAGRSLRALYRWEKKQKQLHLPGGMIADPSAAMGILWCRHGLQTWYNFFTLCIHASTVDVDTTPLMMQAIEASHGDVMGWWSSQSTALVCKGTGPWEAMAQKIGPSRAQTEQDIRKWCATIDDVLRVLLGLQREFDYEDKRKSA